MLTENDYYTNYQDLINDIGQNRFMGITLQNNQVDRIFACINYNDIPICLEGTQNESPYEVNKTLLARTEELWNTTCEEELSDTSKRYQCNIDEDNYLLNSMYKENPNDTYSTYVEIIFNNGIVIAWENGRFGQFSN